MKIISFVGARPQFIKLVPLVRYDTAQFTKNDWRNRNKIKTPRGVMCELKKPPKRLPMVSMESILRF